MGRVSYVERLKVVVTEKKLNIRANSDYDGNRKEFWAFAGKRTKAKKRTIIALRNKSFCN